MRERMGETPAESRHEVVDERAGGAVESGDPSTGGVSAVAITISRADVEVAVRPKHRGVGHVHLTATDELIDESTAGAIKSQHGLDLAWATKVACADVQVVVVRTDHDATGLIQCCAFWGEKFIDEISGGCVLARDVMFCVVWRRKEYTS